MEDTKKELERLHNALLADETMIGEDLTQDLPDDLTDGMDAAAAVQLLEELLPEEPQKVTGEIPAEELPAEEHPELQVDDATLEELLAEVADPNFADPDAEAVTDETMVFANFSNDYGKDLAEYTENGVDLEAQDGEAKKRDDKIVIGLLIAACVLCVGILGVLGYWLAKFL